MIATCYEKWVSKQMVHHTVILDTGANCVLVGSLYAFTIAMPICSFDWS